MTCSAFAISVTVASLSCLRPLVIVHYLRHRGCHTAGVSTAGALTIVRTTLVPLGGDQRAYNGCGLRSAAHSSTKICPLLFYLVRSRHFLRYGSFDLLIVHTQPPFQVVRHMTRVRIKSSGLTISQNRLYGIVCCHNHPTTVRIIFLNDVEIVKTERFG